MIRLGILTTRAHLSLFYGRLIGFGMTPLSYAQMQRFTEQSSQFQRIEQPLWVKGIVTAGGLGLIGLELWWFLLSKPRS